MGVVAGGAKVLPCQIHSALPLYLRGLKKVVPPHHLLVAGSAQTAPLNRFQEALLPASVHLVTDCTLPFSHRFVPFRLGNELHPFKKLLVAGTADPGHG
jgi:hypothetical protein